MTRPTPMSVEKYRPFHETNPVHLPDRTWPDQRITQAPRWLSTDLRDGNQALIEPMDAVRKRQMFDLLVQMGYKEIEVGFPAASLTDFEFVRSIIEDDVIPDDVVISVLTQARADLIERTVSSLVGAKRATVHMYNATAPVFRNVVFRNDKAATVELATRGTQAVMDFAEKILDDDTIFGYQYSPEIFTDTELPFALEVCEAVMDIWQPDHDREIILNLPATVERCTPNIYADQIEWMSRNVSRRDHVSISVHPHNDRGSAVAAAELAIMAGADRVEGCLFGQGERTGNVDLLTLGMNLFSQGIEPGIDFSNIDHIRRTVEHCTQMDVHPRHPYGGDLVYTAFSGSHQDAIKKGFDHRAKLVEAAGGNEAAVAWDVPYLPVDPADVGRTYEEVIRVNSQSGKGGVAYLLASTRHLDLPRRLQIELSAAVQEQSEVSGGEMTAEHIWQVFVDEYLPADFGDNLAAWGRFSLGATKVKSSGDGGDDELTATITDDGTEQTLVATGSGPVAAFVDILGQRGVNVAVLDYAEHALSEGGDASAVAYVECEIDNDIIWGVGIDPSITTATLKAILSAANRAVRVT